MPTFDHDLIIVGSGPAGCATALHLARRAPSLVRRTLILERDRHPRPKLCAGGVMPDAERCLERLGLDLREVPSAPVKRIHLLFRGRGTALDGPGEIAFRVVRRHELDAWLADKVRSAGFTLQEETRVTAVRRVEGGVEVETDRGVLRARAVVGADGSAGVTRRVVQPARGTGVARTVEVVTPASSARFPDDSCAADEAYMEFGAVPSGMMGYSWSFPAVEKGVARRTFGAFDSRVGSAPPSGPLPEVLREEMASRGFALDDYPLAGHPLRWLERGAPLSAPHVLLVGDAAGACALFGEGISPALGYGELAAGALARGFARGDLSFSSYTRDVSWSALGRALHRRRVLARLVYGMRAPVLQAIFSRAAGPALDFVVQRLVFNWT